MTKKSIMQTAKDVQHALEEASNPQIAEHSHRFFKTGPGEYGEGDVFRGIRVPNLRSIASQSKNVPLSEILTLLKSPYHEDRLTALIMMVNMYATSDMHQRQAVFTSYLDHTDYINNWDLVDSSAHKIVGRHLFDRDRSKLYQLVDSPSLWERRISIFATHWFIKRDDFKDTFLLAEILLHDSEDLIHKVVGWMLREVGNRNREAETIFLKRHYASMPRTALRYAIEKYPEDLRQQFLKGEI